MKKTIAALVLGLTLVGCGSPSAEHPKPQPTPVAQQTPDPEGDCVDQTMSLVAAAIEDVIDNQTYGTHGLPRFTQQALQLGNGSVAYQFATQIYPPLVPVLAQQGEGAALAAGSQQAQTMCANYNASTN